MTIAGIALGSAVHIDALNTVGDEAGQLIIDSSDDLRRFLRTHAAVSDDSDLIAGTDSAGFIIPIGHISHADIHADSADLGVTLTVDGDGRFI